MLRFPRSLLAAVLVAHALGTPTTAHTATPDQACAKSKLGASGGKSAKKLKCYATAAAKGVAVDPNCLTKAELKFAAAFTKAEGKGGCLTLNNAGAVEALVDACVNAVRTALGSSAQANACLKKKLDAAGKKAAGKIKCSAKAAAKGALADPTCLSKASDKFVLAWGKAEALGGCLTVNDVNSVETIVDNSCVNPIVAALPVPTPIPTPTRTATPTVTATSTPFVCSESPPATWTGNVSSHNSTRANAQPPPNPALNPLCWKATVASTAQSWANTCTFAHNPNLGMLGLGENIYGCASTDSSCPTNAVAQSVTLWAAEAADYNYAANSCSAVCGHYTQVVWRSSTHVGCGMTICNVNSPFGGFPTWAIVVCDYQPPGNFIGQRPY